MSKVRRSFLFIAFSAALASSISLLGGLGIEYVQEDIILLTPLLIAIPSLTNLVGDYAAIVAAHVGDPAKRNRSLVTLAKGIFTVIWLNIIAILILSLLTGRTRGFEADAVFVIKFTLFISISAVVTVAGMFLLAKTLDILLRKRRINPDELLVPIVTSLADVTMLGLVTLSVITLFKA